MPETMILSVPLLAIVFLLASRLSGEFDVERGATATVAVIILMGTAWAVYL